MTNANPANRRVVVTGLGVVSPNAVGLNEFEAALKNSKSGIRHISKLEELKFGMSGRRCAFFNSGKN